MSVDVLLIVVGWLAGWWLLARVPRVQTVETVPLAPDADRPPLDVSVVIPARNEADNLPHLLGSLATQLRQPAQIIVVDDSSTDDTAAVARAAGATVVEGGELPEGWTGKSWACSQGAQVATGETLVFLDADVRLLPGGLEAVVAERSRRGGLVSVQPFHRMHRLYERLSAVFNTIAVMGVGVASPGNDGRARGAFGPCIACTSEDYRRVGGHGAVRAEILEDLALGRAFSDAGIAVHGAGGRGSVEFRMYPRGIGQLIEGWSKNMASGSASIGVVRLVATLLWMFAAVGVAADTVLWLLGLSDQPGGDVATAWAIFAAQFFVMFRQLGNFGLWPALAFPVVLGMFVIVFLRSLWLTVVRRRVRWRGRDVALPDHTASRRQRRRTRGG